MLKAIYYYSLDHPQLSSVLSYKLFISRLSMSFPVFLSLFLFVGASSFHRGILWGAKFMNSVSGAAECIGSTSFSPREGAGWYSWYCCVLEEHCGTILSALWSLLRRLSSHRLLVLDSSYHTRAPVSIDICYAAKWLWKTALLLILIFRHLYS